MQDIKFTVVGDAALQFKTSNETADQILTYVEKSEILDRGDNETELLVYWGQDETTFIAESFGYSNIPSPILRDYKWPGLFTPFDHQKTTASFLASRRRAFCFNEAGTGKTSSVIWAADYLMSLGLVKRALVICPLTIMYSAWQADVFKTAMHRSVGVAYGPAPKRKKIVNGEYDFIVTNYDGVGILHEDIKNGEFDLIVVDECFVTGTLVSTPLGRQPIEQLEAGDKILTSDGVMCIKRLIRNTTTQLVEVKLGDGKTIRCTPEHPFFTDAGWVCAKNLAGRRLISGLELSCLRAGISPGAFPGAAEYGEQPTPWSDLFKILRSEEMALNESGQERLQQLVARATGETLGAEDARTSGKTFSSSESQGAQAETAQGEWYGDGIERTIDFRGLTCRVGMELPRSVGREATRLSYELQARLRVAPFESGAGGRWGQSHSVGSTAAGSQKGSEAGAAWVESVSYIECPDGEAVYNLEVEGTPNYFVGDHWLVHNCNAYKSTNTVRWKLLAKLIKSDTRLWMLTGTPASQSPLDAFGLARLVAPSRVPKYATAWRDKVMSQISRFKWVPKPSSRQIVFDSLQPAIRFSKAECLDLPEVLYQTREVPLTPQAAKYYKRLKDELLIEAAGEQVSAVNAAARLSKLLQVAGGAVYSDTREVVEFDVSPRLKALDEVLEETENKVIVFVPFTHTIELVSRHLTGNGVTNEIINGAVSGAGRTAIVSRFQTAADPRVLVIQPQAASHGVTLTAADTIVFWSPVMSVETYLQCVARIDRVGQKNRMTVVHLQGSEVERKMYQMLQGKVDSHEKLVDLYKSEIGENYGEP